MDSTDRTTTEPRPGMAIEHFEEVERNRDRDDSERLTQARSRLQAAFSALPPHDWFARIDLGDGHPLTIDGRKPDDTRESPDCIVFGAPSAILHILGGHMEPRYAMLYHHITVEGSAVIATLLFDALAGRKVDAQILVDEAELPVPTNDFALAKRQFERFGYCIIKDALSPAQLNAVRTRLVDQAAGEREAGCAWMEGDIANPDPPNQRVWALVNKGQEFLDLLEHPLVEEFIPELMGGDYLLATLHANITGPGGKPMYLHTDQIMVQPPITDIRFGVNILWFLDEVTEENGGTRILPGSHVGNVAPSNIFTTDGTRFAAGPAGAALIFDSRVWHGTGANVSQGKRHVIIAYYIRYWLRTVENFGLTVRPEVFAKLSDRLKTEMGFRCTGHLGGVDGPTPGRMYDRSFGQIGELRPK